jgi:hypothetical protein
MKDFVFKSFNELNSSHAANFGDWSTVNLKFGRI